MLQRLSIVIAVALVMLGLCGPARAMTTATVTIRGAELSPGGVPDSGTFTISFNGHSESVPYGQYSTASSIAAAFGAKFSEDPNSAVQADPVRLCTLGVCAKSNGAVITFQLGGTALFTPITVTGPSTSFQVDTSNWPAVGGQSSHGEISVAGAEQTLAAASAVAASVQVTVTGFDRTAYVFSPPSCHARTCSTEVYDAGHVTVVCGGTTETTSYSSSSTATNIAGQFATLFNNNLSSACTAASSGATLTLTAATTGTAGNALAVTGSGATTSSNFSGTSFNISPASTTLQGGTDAVAAVSDEGNLTVNLVGLFSTPVSVPFGVGSTPAQLAAALASAIQAQGGASIIVSYTAGSSTMQLQSATVGAATNWQIVVGGSYDSSDFSSSSFSLMGSGMSGGTDAITPVSRTSISFTPAHSAYGQTLQITTTTVETHGLSVQGSVTCSGDSVVAGPVATTGGIATMPLAGLHGGSQTLICNFSGTGGLSDSSATALVSIARQPEINSVMPPSAEVGQRVIVRGRGFGSAGTITFNGVAATPLQWSSSQIIVLVPNGVATGSVPIVVTTVAPSSGFNFVIKPATMKFVKTITFDHTKVIGTDQANFPVLISIPANQDLELVEHGGHVESPSGYDIIFTSDAAGLNRLDHEIDSYNPSTGAADFWVRIPLLSHTEDTSIYLWYGSPSFTVSAENKSGVWSNGYAAVYHFMPAVPNASMPAAGTDTPVMLSIVDSTGTNNGIPQVSASQPLQVGGLIGGGESGAGDLGSNTSLKPQSYTLEAWTAADCSSASPAYGGMISLAANFLSPGSLPENQTYGLGCGGGVSGFVFDTTVAGTSRSITASPASWTGGWNQVVGTFDGSTASIYVDGSLGQQISTPGSIDYSNTGDPSIGNIFAWHTFDNYAWPATLDEVRISSVARSAGWIATEYNNINSPSTFYQLGQDDRSSTMQLNCSPSEIVVGNAISCTVHIRGGAGDTVDLSVGGTLWTSVTLDTNGNATTPATGLSGAATGIYTITAQSPGNANISPSEATTTITVIGVTSSPTLVLSCTPNPAVVGNSATKCSARLPVGATGSVVFTVNGQPWASATLNAFSQASVANGLTSASFGSYTITAAYAGDNNFSAATSSLTLLVNPASTTSPIIQKVLFASDDKGTRMIVQGNGFGAYKGSSVVSLNGQSVSTVEWKDTSITVPLASGVISGSLIVTTNGNSSNSVRIAFQPATCP